MVKKCPHCGLKYFCKTTSTKWQTYTGSGKYWVRHIKAHKVKPETILIKSYEKADQASKVASRASKIWRIASSSEWANLIDENALDGGVVGDTHPMKKPEAREKMRKVFSGKKLTEDHRNNIIKAMKSPSVKQKMSQNHADVSGEKNPMYGTSGGMKGKKHTPETLKKLSILKSGANHHMYGKKHSVITAFSMLIRGVKYWGA